PAVEPHLAGAVHQHVAYAGQREQRFERSGTGDLGRHVALDRGQRGVVRDHGRTRLLGAHDQAQVGPARSGQPLPDPVDELDAGHDARSRPSTASSTPRATRVRARGRADGSSGDSSRRRIPATAPISDAPTSSATRAAGAGSRPARTTTTPTGPLPSPRRTARAPVTERTSVPQTSTVSAHSANAAERTG